MFCEKIENIVSTVKDKLSEDAKKDQLVTIYPNKGSMSTASTDSDGSYKGKNTQSSEVVISKDYREYQPKFDEILSAVGDYFELFKNNTNKLEDLWLQLLDYLKLKNPKPYTVFKHAHYSVYIRKVIKFNVIQKICEEAQKWVGTDKASENLEGYLEKIREIEKEANFIADSYESFKRLTYLDMNLNQYTEQVIKLQREKEEIENAKAKSRAFKQQVDYQQQQKPQQHSLCSDNYNDCQQFESHKKGVISGCCHCRCIARNHLFQHYGTGKSRPRKTGGRKETF